VHGRTEGRIDGGEVDGNAARGVDLLQIFQIAAEEGVEAEVGLAGVWTRYDERYSAKQVRTADKSRVLVLPSRIGLSLAYVF